MQNDSKKVEVWSYAVLICVLVVSIAIVGVGLYRAVSHIPPIKQDTGLSRFGE